MNIMHTDLQSNLSKLVSVFVQDGVTVEDISITAGYAEISVMIKEHMHAL